MSNSELSSARGAAPSTFVFAQGREPHAARAKEILKAHADIRKLAGRNPWSAVLIAALVVFETAAAWLLSGQPVWLILLAAWAVGAFASHALWVLIHDCAHNLVVRSGPWNKVFAMTANLPHLFPSAVSFQKYHLKHHAFQGVYELDADLPNTWEARLVGSSALRKALWLLFFPFFQLSRPPRLKEISLFDGWVVVNIVVQVVYDAAVLYFLGPKALLFLAAAFFFSVGLHPLGARWIQEHYLVHGTNQETTSYYGFLNVPALNVGYHNEHHDFPWVPWHRLPLVRRAAPEAYDTLAYHRSWTKLLFLFLFDSRISLFSRVVRAERGGVPVVLVEAPVSAPAAPAPVPAGA
jgi:sphingolipid delta-4 desaturase